MDVTVSRRMWELFEPLHAVVYFTPQARRALDAAGMRGFWMGYVAARVAPLGPVGAAVATAVFYGFHPGRAARALPDAWGYGTPAEVLAARRTGSADALRALLGDEVVASTEFREAAGLLWTAAQRADPAGRVLGAANQTLPEPADPVEKVWQATTTLREHRGDGHVGSLISHGVTPVQSHLLKSAAGEVDEQVLRIARAWPDEAWDQARDELLAGGWIDRDGAVTETGRSVRDDVERATDAAALGPWRMLGVVGTERLAALLGPWAKLIADCGILTWPNPIGVTRPDRGDADAR